MDALLFGLQLTAVGMGTVFLLLAALMVLLMGLGHLDRPEPRRPLTGGLDQDPAGGVPVSGSPEGDTGALVEEARDRADPDAGPDPATAQDAPAAPVVRVHAHGLDDDLLAAITVAVVRHAELRRRQAAPETRSVPPGAQLRHSRWVSLGRTPPPTTRS